MNVLIVIFFVFLFTRSNFFLLHEFDLNCVEAEMCDVGKLHIQYTKDTNKHTHNSVLSVF